MASPFPTDNLAAIPVAEGAEKTRSSKSTSRRARRDTRSEARLFQSYTMAERDDLEEYDDGSQSAKRPRKKNGEPLGRSTPWSLPQTSRELWLAIPPHLPRYPQQNPGKGLASAGIQLPLALTRKRLPVQWPAVRQKRGSRQLPGALMH